MKEFSQYDTATGLFTSQIVTGIEAPQATPGYDWKEGAFDHVRQRVEIPSGEVVEYVAPPADDARRVKRRAQAMIEQLERRQLRPLRELTRDPANRTARLRIDELDIEISKLRSQL